MFVPKTAARRVTAPAALSVGRTHAAPSRSPAGAAKTLHVRAQFRHYHFGHFAVDPRYVVQALDQPLLLRQPGSNLPVEGQDLFVATFDVRQQLTEDELLMGS